MSLGPHCSGVAICLLITTERRCNVSVPQLVTLLSAGIATDQNTGFFSEEADGAIRTINSSRDGIECHMELSKNRGIREAWPHGVIPQTARALPTGTGPNVE